MAKSASKTLHESFVRFFESPTRESLRVLLQEHMGENRNCDFKEQWPEHGPLAKHLLGLVNTGGGCLIVGVEERSDKTLHPSGLSEIKDKADVVNGIKLFLPEPLQTAIEIGDFSYDATEYASLIGKRFQVVFVHPRPAALPFVAQKAGSGIRSGAIYIRREGQTEEATYDEVQRLIVERLNIGPQTAEARSLKEHLEELKVLYAEIPRYLQAGSFNENFFQQLARATMFFGGESRANPNYPAEDYQAFVLRALEAKKKVIESELRLRT
ncbi:ATP-binding protein [Tahibacter sp.]|uniref:AlbA family DNA-binding domain-containing protein n=1 Tax=Tahibacter sp. TaxID=2056211 RepID=UPI0028C402BC|nr:ATP-binding protein [Tahibacter sp.]